MSIKPAKDIEMQPPTAVSTIESPLRSAIAPAVPEYEQGVGAVAKGNPAKVHKWMQYSVWKVVLYYLSMLASGGILFVVSVNKPKLKKLLTTSECDPSEATMVFDGENFADISKVALPEKEGGNVIVFEMISTRYYASSKDNYKTVQRVPDEPTNFSDAYVCGVGERLSRETIRSLYGLNRLTLQAADPFNIVMLEVLSPFYIFQYFAVAVWIYTFYYIYSAVVMFITILSIYFVSSDKLFNLKRLHDLADTKGKVDMTDRQGSKVIAADLPDSEILPGDCFFVKEGMSLPCDAILISGRVVVDEALLTGESIPITKTQFVKSVSDTDATKRTANILYCGTTVKSIGHGASAGGVLPVAMAYKTGFRSAKGSIVAVLAQPEHEIVSFMPDALRAILFMVIITTAIFGWSADQLKGIGTTDGDVVIAYLTALTIAVPPGLVACLSVATSISVVRLSKKNITISDTAKLNAAGYVSVACFDKTGTLTDENIVFQGTHLYECNAQTGNKPVTVVGGAVGVIANQTMATCHSLSILDDKPVGDQLEVELLRASGWTIRSSESAKHLVAIPPEDSSSAFGGKEFCMIKHFEFSPDKLRSGTLLELPNKGPLVFLMKGSPEKIIALCSKRTVPDSIDADILGFTKQGFRVLAMAYSACTDMPRDWYLTASQDDIEQKGLTFVGLVYFSNRLKPDTFPKTIQSLKDANIHVAMITGDHVETAIAISSDCNILPKKADREMYVFDADSKTGSMVIIDSSTDKVVTNLSVAQLVERLEVAHSVAPTAGKTRLEVVITGPALAHLHSNMDSAMFLRLLRRVAVFARTKPSQKKLVVTELKKPLPGKTEQSYVMFCGDGANDMEALAAATVGVSLCDTATTVAASIVSVNQSPYSTVEVLAEGRCSLVTAYILVSYNIMYAIIQLFMTCYLNNVGLIFGDGMYLVQDMFYSLVLGLCIANTPPEDKLCTRLPPKRLFSVGLMVKLLLQLGIFPVFQYIALELLYQEHWFEKFDAGDDPLTEAWAAEGAVLNIVALAQLMIASVVVTIGRPFRNPWYTNKSHLGCMALQAAYILYLMFAEENEFSRVVTNYPVKAHFYGIIIGIIAANAAASALATHVADYFFAFDEYLEK